MGTLYYSQAIKPDTAYLKKIIESSLLCDWAIRVEYYCEEKRINCWQLWDKTYFAIRSARDVLRAISNCYKSHPRSTIRLHAEKFHPQTRMLFTVYNPQYLPAETEVRKQSSRQPYSDKHDQPRSPVRITTQ